MSNSGIIKLNCQSCGGELIKKDKNIYHCDYCSSDYMLKNDDDLGFILELLNESRNGSQIDILMAQRQINIEKLDETKDNLRKNIKNIEIINENIKILDENATVKRFLSVGLSIFLGVVGFIVGISFGFGEISGLFFWISLITSLGLCYWQIQIEYDKSLVEYKRVLNIKKELDSNYNIMIDNYKKIISNYNTMIGEM